MTNNNDNRCPVCGGITKVKDSNGKPCACSRGCKKRHKLIRNQEAAAKAEAKANAKKK